MELFSIMPVPVSLIPPPPKRRKKKKKQEQAKQTDSVSE